MKRGVECDQLYPSWILLSAAHLPDRSEALQFGKVKEFTSEFLNEVHRLEMFGVQFFVVPCNTAHAFFPHIEGQIGLPYVHMIDAVCDSIDFGRGAPGLLCTSGTLATRLYQSAFERAERPCISFEADQQLQELCHELVYSPQRGLKATGGKPSVWATDNFGRCVAALLERGATQVILGCTELSVFSDCPAFQHLNFVDPLQVLARRTIDRALGGFQQCLFCPTVIRAA
jgi:aspartate racemase